MADYFYGSISIGGTIPHLLRQELRTRLFLQGLLGHADSLERHIYNGTVLFLDNDQARYGKFEDLEDWLQQSGIEFDRFSNGYCEYDPVVASYRPDLGLIERPCNQDQATVVLRSDITGALATCTTHDQLVGELHRIVGCGIPPLTPLRLPSEETA